MIIKKIPSKLATAILLAFFILSSASYSLAQPEQGPFTDVPRESKFFVPVNFLKEQGFINGYEDGSFHPNRETTRAEALAMIMKLTGKSVNADGNGENAFEKTLTSETPFRINLPKEANITFENLATGEIFPTESVRNINVAVGTGTAILSVKKTVSEKPFKDVREINWYFELVTEAKRLGIVQGRQDGKYFRPNQYVNLAETLRMLFKSAGLQIELQDDEKLPPDISKDDWYAKDFAYAVKKTMLTQDRNGYVFPPHETLSRGEMALLLYRFFKSQAGNSFGYASWYADGLAKTKITHGLEYKEKNLTAAHKTLPFGTIVRVINVINGRQVDVVINDRGPFVTGRIIDLSKSAFRELESTTVGIIQAEMEIIQMP